MSRGGGVYFLTTRKGDWARNRDKLRQRRDQGAGGLCQRRRKE